MITSRESFNSSAAAVLLACSLALGAPSPSSREPDEVGARRELRALAAQDADSGYARGLQFRLLKTVVQPGERTTLEIQLPVAALEGTGWKEEDGPPTVNDELLTQTKNFLILDTTYRRTSTHMIWGYEVTAHRVGAVSLPPVEIRVGPRTFSTESLVLRINTTRAEDDNRIREEYGPLKPPSRWWYWLVWLSLLPLALYVRRCLDRWLPKLLARLQRRLEPLPPVEPEEDPAEWLKRELARIHAAIAEAPREGHADELTDALREYFQRLTRRPVRAWTTREFLARLTEDGRAPRLRPVLVDCDAIKFAARRESLGPRLEAAVTESEKVLCGT